MCCKKAFVKLYVYISGWFQGLSEKFLACECPKMLLLAGVDRLDKELTIGQMQGESYYICP